jgi:hypothetical protein
MAWRVFNSLLVLRDQVNAIAPDRSKGADGTICDTNHPTTSDHCPHNVPGVGPEMVSALDLTHDPDGGFDSYKFAEVLRTHRDKRIKYVISNRRIFDSSGSDAWTWRTYSGTDPHTNHVHISVLDAAISDDKTPWNLEGFGMSEAEVITGTVSLWDQTGGRKTPTGRAAADDFNLMVSNALADEFKKINDMLATLESKLDLALVKLNAIQEKLDTLTPGTPTLPVPYTFSGVATPQA